jgi:hypothetical protein
MTRKIDTEIQTALDRRLQAMTDGPAAAGHDSRPLCGATKRDGSGDPCRRPAGWGTTHVGSGTCKLHLGSTVNAGRAAERERAMREALRFAPHLERDEDPAEVLLSLLRSSRALAAYWEDLLTRGTAALHTTGPGGERRPSVEVTLWEAEKDRAEKIASTCIRLGLEERRVRVAEGMGDAMFAAVEAGFLAAGIDMDSDLGRVAFERSAVAFEKKLKDQARDGIAKLEQHLGRQSGPA